MVGPSDERPTVGDRGRQMLRWVSLLDLFAFFLVVASIFLSWQTSVGRYPGGSFSYHYYVYGTQCAHFGSGSTCTTTSDLPIALRGTEYLVVMAVPVTLIAAVLGRVASRAGTHARGSAALSAGFSGAGLAGLVSATVLYAQYTYAEGTGLWDSPSTAGLGWNIAVAAAVVLLAAITLTLWARRKPASPASRRSVRDRVPDAGRPPGTRDAEVAVVARR